VSLASGMRWPRIQRSGAMADASGIQDSQCGSRRFRRERPGPVRSRDDRRLDLDVGVLYMARRRGYRIVEVPIPWHYDASSRVQPVRDTIGMCGSCFSCAGKPAPGAYDPLPS